MPQEPVAQETSAGIGWRVASTDKHNTLKADPLLVGLPVETVLLSHLAQESDHRNSSVLVGLWKIDFVAEDY